MVSFTQLISTAIATAAFVVAVPAPIAQAAPVTTETAPLVLTAGGYFASGVITAEGTYSTTSAAGVFTVTRDPSNTNNVLISSTLGPCGVKATVFVCSATTTAASFGYQTFGTGLDLTAGGILSFNGVGFSGNNADQIVNLASDFEENLLVGTQ